MVTYRGFSACIKVEEKPLPEYLVAVDADANKVSCWIPSEAGKHFSVHWRDEGSQVHSCAFIYLDGLVAPGRFLNGYGETSREGIRTGHQVERPFVFAQQATTSSGVIANHDVGTIVLKIRLVRMEGRRSANPLQHLPEPVGWQNNVLSHYISYGEERYTYTQHPCTWRVMPYDASGNRSHVTFIFRYRSREFLLSQGIATTENTPQTSPIPAVPEIIHRVISAPLPSASTARDQYMMEDWEQAWSASRMVPVQPVTYITTKDCHVLYPGESVPDFPDPTMGYNTTWIWAGEGVNGM